MFSGLKMYKLKLLFFTILDASSEDTDMLDNMYFEEEDWGVS